MKKILSIFLALIISFSVFAHEGMWIPSLLRALEDDMQANGLKLSAEDIYSINHSSIKDAIVHFGGGCTAEVVSENGLILTNHHCGFSQIQQHSSLENDYLKNGFWAMSNKEELKNPNLTASFIVRIQDVTKEMNAAVTPDMDATTAYKKKFEKGQQIVQQATEGNGYEAVVKPFNYGNSYYLIVTETYKDVRLVGAPPSAIGKFGGDTDNWVWPRHTGDFSVFRIYAGKDNKPAEISDENIPYSPKHVLPVSLEGLKEGDFTMVFGFPGRTDQYLTSYAVENYVNVLNPARINMRKESLAIIDAAMLSSDKTRIQYAAKQSRISNAYKKWVGQNLGLKKYDAIGKKQAFEGEFLKRVPRDGKYKNILQNLKLLTEKMSPYQNAYYMFYEIWYYGPEIIRFSHGFDKLMTSEDFDKDLKERKDNYQGFFKNYDVEIDKKVFKKLLPMYLSAMGKELSPKLTLLEKYKGNTDAMVDYIYSKSVFCSEEKLNKLLSSSEKKFKKILSKDPAYVIANQIFDNNEIIKGEYYGYNVQVDALMKNYVAGQMEYFPEKTFWADANNTMRLTYGKAEGSYPRDGMKYTWFTTLDGIIEKNNTGEKDFEITPRLKELWEKKDYGRYADEDGTLRVCFLGSNHTTGGNSGSPAINGEGHLVGINFDRTWESTMSDIMFDENICRNIMVDIRYVLWVMDKYAGATRLVDEMILVDEKYRENEKEKELKFKITQYSNRLRDVPTDVYAYMGRSSVYIESGDEESAMADLNKAVELQPKNTSALNARAELYISQNKLELAYKDVESALKVDKNDGMSHFLKGVILTNRKEFPAAIKELDFVIQHDFEAAEAYYYRGVCYYELKDGDEACRNFEMGSYLGSENAHRMMNLTCMFGAW